MKHNTTDHTSRQLDAVLKHSLAEARKDKRRSRIKWIIGINLWIGWGIGILVNSIN
jgi:hypothetical protein